MIKAAYEEADCALPEDRAAILDRVCNRDLEVRREVEKLLAGDVPTADFINDAIAHTAAGVLGNGPAEDRFGPYQIVRRIGQGGMGTVFEAVRLDSFRKKVALKIIKQELDSTLARTRFQQERQLLAALEHPYIARLIDGGETRDGSPYLVLEFVDGQPADQYWAPLGREARLRLFLKVCEAVEYAHRNLVIHRDLKPANILVVASGDPKLLDFGIAKFLSPDPSATQTAVAAFTPDYASPEQVRSQSISTASDVYSLGVILYQLLTDRKPYTFNKATAGDIDRTICEQPPAPPGLGDELDQILLMALRKEPERRYGSVRQFAEDIERYLDHRPVFARPDTALYRTRKYARRHWVALLAASVALTGICGGAAMAIYQARIANQRFEQVRNLSHRFIFDFNDAIRQLPGSTAAREMLVNTALEYLDNLSRNAHGDRSLQWELAKAYEKVGDVQGSPVEPSLGHAADALKSYQKSVAMQEDLATSGALDKTQYGSLAHTYAQIAAVHRIMRHPQEAVQAASHGVEWAQKASGASYASALSHLALAEVAAGEPARALETGRSAVGYYERETAAEKDWGEAHNGLAALHGSMGIAQARMARFEGAVGDIRKAIALRETRLKAPVLDAMNARELVLEYHALADILGGRDRFSLGRTAEAIPWYRKALALAEKLSAADAKNASARFEIARSAGKLGSAIEETDPKEALELYARALDVATALLPEGSPRDDLRSAAFRSMASPLAKLRRLPEARQKLQVSLEIDQGRLTRSPGSRSVLTDLSEDWLERGNLERPTNKAAALEYYRKALDLAEQAAALAPKDLTAAYLQVRCMEALIAMPDSAAPDGPRLRQRLVELWTKWNQLQPGSPFIQERLRSAQVANSSTPK